MKPIFFYFTAAVLCLGFAFPAQANDTRQVLYVGCQTHTASQPSLVRPYGDSNGWTFEVQLIEGASWVEGSQHWSHSGGSGENADPTWGQWTNGEVGGANPTTQVHFMFHLQDKLPVALAAVAGLLPSQRIGLETSKTNIGIRERQLVRILSRMAPR